MFARFSWRKARRLCSRTSWCTLLLSNITQLIFDQGLLSFAHGILSYLLDILDLSHSSNFDEGIFQVYQDIGKDMTSRACNEVGSLTAKLRSELGSRLVTFNESWQLHSGLGMELLWTAFRPVGARSLNQLDLSNQAKNLADRFDALRWGSGTSVQGLCSLQRSITKIHNAIEVAPLPDASSIEVRVHCSLLSEIGLLRSEQDVQETLLGLEGRLDTGEVNVAPYFEFQFEMLCQYKACGGELESLESHSELGLLAGRPTARLMKFGRSLNKWQALAQIQQATAVGCSDVELAAVRNIMPTSMLHKLEAINEVPLRSLGLLRFEVDSICQVVAGSSATLCGEPLQNLNRLLFRLREHFHEVILTEVSYPSLEKIKIATDQFLRHVHDRTRGDDITEHLHRSLEQVFDRQQPEGLMAGDERSENIACTSAAFIQFFTGCLLLFVPDRPCDPALKPMVARNRHKKRRSELESKLWALKEFQVIFSGQNSSLRSQLMEKRIDELGAEPEVPMIFRPQISELGRLQAEFNNILKSIILRSPTPSMLQSVIRRDLAKCQEVELLRSNIVQAVSRLSHQFQAYEDITKPLIAFLQGLDIGLALSLLTGSRNDSRDQSIRYLCKMTPFLGADPQGIARITIDELDLYRSQSFDARSHLLKFIGMARTVSKVLGDPFLQKMFQTFQSFYQEWKYHLGRDQEKHLAQSSLFRYRGGEDEGRENDKQDFYSLFSDFDRACEDNFASNEPGYDARDQARRLARLHREIFQYTKVASEQLLNLLHDASKDVAELWKTASKVSTCSLPAENLFPALILCLDQDQERLLSQDKAGKLYNFYTDANLSEAQNIIALVSKTQERFQDLQETWPEHGTLIDVLRTSSELLALRHTEPIAKILTKAEQLHGYVHEWQTVASKQYSVATLYEQLTDLLISWRRLELSTWARLLDMEDQKCNEDADSWWFIAYEVIVAIPLSMADAGECLQVHVEHLFTTLAKFIGDTSIGQYAHRLSMIDSFRNHLEALAKFVPSMKVVQKAISNFQSYYARFKKLIQEHLQQGRQKLERDMKEILLFASWKDTNINALRDSAKRSHHKLFKVIRKYRSLLAQSADTFITGVFASENDVSSSSKQNDNTHEVVKTDRSAIDICKSHLESWESRPERYRNPSSTAQRMLEMGQLSLGAINCASYLDSFDTDLADSIKVLQKETPAKASKENGDVIKHLKARKRKAYAEALKTLRHMGLKSNMSADDLAKQSSLSIVLSNSSTLATQSHHQLASAEFHFHKVLHLMQIIKERSRDPSKDLSHGEIARSMGYLESLISVILKQRSVLAIAFTDLEDLHKTTHLIRNLWAPALYALKKPKSGPQMVAEEARHSLRWLPTILQAGSTIIEKHGKMGKIDRSTILTDLKIWKDKMTNANNAFDQLPALPFNLSSSLHEQVYHDAVGLLEDFENDTRKLIEKNPDLAFVLKQIAYWTSKDIAYDTLRTNAEQTISVVDLDRSVSNALDSILIAVQRMQEVSSKIPSSTEDASWLLRADFLLVDSLKTLNPREINEILQEAVNRIQYLNEENDSDVLVAGALFTMALPIVEEYCSTLQMSFNRYAELHRAFCKLSDHLAHSFSQIVQEGFCSPAEDSAAEAGNTEKLEGGTGLGEGEGAEDISHDIQDDEDLSELAQGPEKEKKQDGIEAQENAVDMDHNELEGDMGDPSDTDEESGSVSEGEEHDIDEEEGNVNDTNPSAVDEKLWNGEAGRADKEKEGAKARGKPKKNDLAADEAAGQRESTQVPEGEEDGDAEDDTTQDGMEEAAEAAREETEKIDPHVQESENLDLPEDMDLDNANRTDTDSASAASDMEGMSDVEQEDAEDEGVDSLSQTGQDHEIGGDEVGVLDQAEVSNKDNGDDDNDKSGDAGSPVDTDPDNEESAGDPGFLEGRTDNQSLDQEGSLPNEAIGLGQDIDKNDAGDQQNENKAQDKDGAHGNTTSTDDRQVAAEDGQLGQLDSTQNGQPGSDEQNTNRSSQAFKKLGNALEKWHRQHRQIQEAPEKEENAPPQTDADMRNPEFEHLRDEEVEADAQALGAASNDQARALDQRAMESEMQDEPPAFPFEELEEEGGKEGQETLKEETSVQLEAQNQQEQSRRGGFIASKNEYSRLADEPGTATLDDEEKINDLDSEFSTTHLQPSSAGSARSAEESRRLWSYYESLTRDLSLSLTEQLRLILAPTLATKMRGDFRTGKRLNIKRIIPYIASQYKRDKIWMRRSIPSKRSYQIMLAVDDSKSMEESGSGQLAFETLALVSKSLSILEVGEICVVGFGNEVRVAHDFDTPFSSEAGAQILQHFGFQQTKTNVRKLVAESITLFREARRRTFNSGTDLWQLELIISDGVCEDHDTIRRLVRQAQEERIMIVFVIVDSLLKGESVMEMTQAVFEPDAAGETKLNIKPYMDGFPFPYYLVVGDVRELPGVLAQALRQWFAEVVQSG